MTSTTKCACEREYEKAKYIHNTQIHSQTHTHTQWSGFILCSFGASKCCRCVNRMCTKFLCMQKLKYGHRFCFGYFIVVHGVHDTFFHLRFYLLTSNVAQQYINNIRCNKCENGLFLVYVLCAWTVASILSDYLTKKNYRFTLIITIAKFYEISVFWILMPMAIKHVHILHWSIYTQNEIHKHKRKHISLGCILLFSFFVSFWLLYFFL